jgi:hypothetical protein
MTLWSPYEGTGWGESKWGRIERTEIRSQKSEVRRQKAKNQPLRGLLVASTPRKSTQLRGFTKVLSL